MVAFAPVMLIIGRILPEPLVKITKYFSNAWRNILVFVDQQIIKIYLLYTKLKQSHIVYVAQYGFKRLFRVYN